MINHSSLESETQEIIAFREACQQSGKTIVLCHGVFDVVHPGHVAHLQEAKKHGDVLVVSVTPDAYVNKGPGHPIFPQLQRMSILRALNLVDMVVPSREPDAVGIINILQPQIYAKGKEYEGKDVDANSRLSKEIAAVEVYGGHIIYTDTMLGSSSGYINHCMSPYSMHVRDYLAALREKYTPDTIMEWIDLASRQRILVIGEAIEDEYRYIIPPDIPPPLEFLVMHSTNMPVQNAGGGIRAVANHIHGVYTLKTMGHITQSGSIHKTRYIHHSEHRPVVGIYSMPQPLLSDDEEKRILSTLEKELDNVDVVIAVDYGHGLFTPPIRHLLQMEAHFLALNCQTNTTNYGTNIVNHRYDGMDYLSLNKVEWNLALDGDHPKTILDELTQVRKRMWPGVTMLTRGRSGSTIFSRDMQTMYESPSLGLDIVDTVGAGDALFAITAPLVAVDCPLDIVGFIGNLVAALKMRHIHNTHTITYKEVQGALHGLLAKTPILINQQESVNG